MQSGEETNHNRLVEIYSAANAIQANILRNLLEDEGIAATLFNEQLESGGAGGLVGWSTAVKVYVCQEDGEVARTIALKWEETIGGT